MSTIAHSSHASGLMGWIQRAEAWLDDRGRTGWIIATILAFVLAWPLGLAFVGYMIWSRKMSQLSSDRTCSRRRVRSGSAARSSGNAAFDAYRNETLRRLEEEQEQFEAFLQRLRDARDKAEFDQFMEERGKRAAADAEDEVGKDA